MALTRRTMLALLPVLAAGVRSAEAEVRGAGQAMPGRVYHSATIPYVGDATKKGRRFFMGPQQTGFNLEVHETVLGASTETHPPHTHAHEEIIIVVEGAVEVSVEGRKELAETGSVIYYEANKPHSLRNAGTAPCRYYVVELRGAEAHG